MATHPLVIRSYTMNSSGQLTSMAQRVSGTTTSYAYDARGN